MTARNSAPGFEQTHAELNVLSFWIFLLALPMLLASVFSFPFPFVRQGWIKEMVGLAGPLNVLLMGWISLGIKRMHLPPMTAGIGLFLNEQILTGYGFMSLFSAGHAGKKDVFFLAVSAIAGLIFLILLIRAFQITVYYKKWFYEEGPGSEQEEEPAEFLPLILSLLMYAVLFVGVYFSKFLSWPWPVTALKGISQAASFMTCLGIGYEIQFYLRKDQSALQCWVKALSHLMGLAIILLLVYHRMPIEAMLRG